MIPSPCRSRSPYADQCGRPRGHKKAHRTLATSRPWTGGIRTDARWVANPEWNDQNDTKEAS